MDSKKIPVEPSWFVDQAAKRIKLGLVVADIVSKNSLSPTPEQIRKHIEELAQSYEQPQELVKWYYANPERLSSVEDIAVEDNVIEWISKQVRVSDKDVSFDELMNSQQTA